MCRCSCKCRWSQRIRLERGGGVKHTLYTSHGLIKRNTSQDVGGDGVAGKEWNGVYVEEQVRDKGFDIGGRREKAGRFFLFGQSTKQEKSKDRGISSKKQNV